MASYTVHAPELSTGDPVKDGERIIFVRDGFSFLALAFPLLWLLANRLWTALLIYVIVSVAIGYFVREPLSLLCLGAINIILAFEGDSLRRLGLSIRGYRMVDLVTGYGRDDCERRFFDRFDGHVGINRRFKQGKPGTVPLPPTAKDPQPIANDDNIIGLFPHSDTVK